MHMCIIGIILFYICCNDLPITVLNRSDDLVVYFAFSLFLVIVTKVYTNDSSILLILN
jgi:hypothetical protein